MKMLLLALILLPVISQAEYYRQQGPYQREASEDFRNNGTGYGYGYGGYGYYPDVQQPTFRQTPQYQEETLQNAGDPMQEEELQNINDMSNEPDIG